MAITKEMEIAINETIPKLEALLPTLEGEALMDAFKTYEDMLMITAPYNFHNFNKFLEFDEDHNDANKAFYHHRKHHLKEVFDSLNDMEIYDKYNYLVISTPPRAGKEQPLSAKILTPTGWTTMGEIKVGDNVIGYNGKATKVTGVFPQGVKDIYEVTFSDGTKTRCGLEHLWTVRTRDDRKFGKERTVSLKNMMKNLKVENQKRLNYSVDYVEPIEFENNLDDGDLHPYLLGVLIGDGNLGGTGIKLTNVDIDILNRVESLLPTSDKMTRVSNTITFYIGKEKDVRSEKGFMVKCITDIKINEYGLKCNSDKKFIPKKYLYSSLENRIELLKGLMDSDGYSGDRKTSYMEYTTTSEKLKDDVVELILSLGGRANVFVKESDYKTAYRISFNLTFNPFYCKRKFEKFTSRTKRKYKYIKSVELVGKEECQCIMVDSPKHLYVTDDYILTHNTTSGIRFLAWIIGKYPESSQLATSHSDSITVNFYNGILEIVQSDRYQMMFPDCPLVKQNAKNEEIWLKTIRRYPSITFVPINGSFPGRCEAGRYLYCDDLVSGIEEALSQKRMAKLQQLYSVDCVQRKLESAKEIHIATRWSVHDPVGKVLRDQVNNPKLKVISIDCYNEYGESNLDFTGGFSTKYYKDIESTMDKLSFEAIYRQNPIERDGLLYPEEDLQRYLSLPNEPPDAVIMVCDSKGLGKDYVSAPLGYVYGDLVYIEDVVYNNGLPEITRPKVANLALEHKVGRMDIELNNGGNYYAEEVDKIIKEKGGKTSIRIFFSGNNKVVKIITYADIVKKHFIFKDKSLYSPNSEYAQFMKALVGWTQKGTNFNDDAPDSIAMLAQFYQDLSGKSIKIMDRRELGI